MILGAPPQDLLARCTLFCDLSAARLADLAAATHERHYPRGTLIMQKGDRPATLMVVARGKLKETCQSPSGEERIVELLGPQRTCGETALLLDQPLPFAIVALTDVQLLHVDGQTVLALIDTEPRLVRRLLSALSARLHVLVRDVETYTLYGPVQRVAAFLVEQSRPQDDCSVVHLPAAKTVVASRLGMTPEALSRAFRDLADAGLIEVRKNHVTLLDRKRLATVMA